MTSQKFKSTAQVSSKVNNFSPAERSDDPKFVMKYGIEEEK